MSKVLGIGLGLVVGLIVGALSSQFMMKEGDNLTVGPEPLLEPELPSSFSAVPDAIGAQDISGPYEVVQAWPQDLASLPGHEEWTYGGARGIFAESPDRVFLLGGGELPNIQRPQMRQLTDIGPNVLFPVGGLPWRNANLATPPGSGGARQDPSIGMEAWRGSEPPFREMGVDARRHHSIIVVNREGEIIEDWTQWDDLLKRPHSI